MKKEMIPPASESARLPGEGSAQSVDKTPAPAPPAPPREEPQTKSRKDILDEVAIKLGTGVKNSAELVAYWCMYDNPDQIRTHYKLLRDRLAEVHAILRDQIQNLPEL